MISSFKNSSAAALACLYKYETTVMSQETTVMSQDWWGYFYVVYIKINILEFNNSGEISSTHAEGKKHI